MKSRTALAAATILAGLGLAAMPLAPRTEYSPAFTFHRSSQEFRRGSWLRKRRKAARRQARHSRAANRRRDW